MSRRAKLALLGILLAIGAAYRGLCSWWSEPVVYTHELGAGDLLAVGDFQRTSLIEQWVMRREQNDSARARVIAEMRDEENVGGLLLLGDLVFDGSSCSDWEAFDELFAPLAARGVVLALGNHDYWGPDVLACANLEPRFPWIREQTWGVSRWGDVAVVWLDSNAYIDEQAEWLESTLGQLDARAVIVTTHHPPYTNSTVTGDEPHVQEAFVSLLTPNVRLFLSGHAHAYEHFDKEGVHYVVSGGGGGPRVKLLRGDEARHDDVFDSPSPRPFHWLRIRQDSSGLEVIVRGFQKDRPTYELDRFRIAFAR